MEPIINVVSIIVYATMLFATFMDGHALGRWKRSVRGSRESYVARTKAKAWAYVLIVGSLVLYGMLFLVSLDSFDKAFAWMMAILTSGNGTFTLFLLSKDDEDDGFSKRFRRLRRRTKNIITSMRKRRLAYVRP